MNNTGYSLYKKNRHIVVLWIGFCAEKNLKYISNETLL